jgi:ADP-ribose pyrophosphatase YjhB (NUDIX family)
VIVIQCQAIHAPRRRWASITYEPPVWPGSVKGVAVDVSGRLALLKNERQEWELPGGRLEIGNEAAAQVPDESPELAVEREILRLS